MSRNKNIIVKDLGKINFEDCFDIQKELQNEIIQIKLNNRKKNSSKNTQKKTHTNPESTIPTSKNLKPNNSQCADPKSKNPTLVRERREICWFRFLPHAI